MAEKRNNETLDGEALTEALRVGQELAAGKILIDRGPTRTCARMFVPDGMHVELIAPADCPDRVVAQAHFSDVNSFVEYCKRFATNGSILTGNLTTGETVTCDRLLIATGGGKAGSGLDLARQLGHTVDAPVPSLGAPGSRAASRTI